MVSTTGPRSFYADLDLRYSKAGGFFLAFVYFYLGMAALGLSLEAMITILTPVFTPFFLFTLVSIFFGVLCHRWD